MITPTPATEAISPRHRASGRGLYGVFRAGARSVLMYRGDLAMGILSMIVQVTLTMTVWRVVYGDQQEVAGISRTNAVGYAVLAASFQTIVMPWAFSSIPQRIRKGQIALDLTRPHGLIGQTLAQNFGTMAARAPIGASGIVWAIILGAAQPPAGVPAALCWVLSMALGVTIALLLNLIVSLSAFWTMETGGPMMVYRIGSAFLSGALIPLWFMPAALASALRWLPFQAQMYTPLTIYFGTVHGRAVVAAIAVQVLWIVVLWALLQLIWSRAQRRVVVQGG